MTITTVDGIANSLGNNSSRLVIDKASIASAVAGQFYSLWRATGQPGQGAIPTTAAACAHGLLGSFGFSRRTDPATSYGAYLEAASSNASMTLEIHDRLAHMGGLSGILTTAQTVNVDLNALLATSNIDVRKGDSNYSDVQWWLEWYTDTGATASNATVAVTYNDATSGNLTVTAVGGTLRASRMVNLNGLIPAAAAGKYIRDVDTVTLSASTAAAGNFGVTATRPRMTLFMPIANAKFVSNWADLGFPSIANGSCLFPIVLCSTTTTGTLRGGGKVVHG